MSTILWQSQSPVIFESFQKGQLHNAANGGNAYDFQAAQVLSQHFNISIDQHAVRTPGENILAYWWRMKRYRPSADVFIMEPFPLLFGSAKAKSKSVAMIHHIDATSGKMSIKHRWLFNQLKKQLPKTDLVITVSEYWADYLRSIGCTNVKVIYNAFHPEEYRVADETVKLFKKQFEFHDESPIVYIGNASRHKGVYETYHALKNYNFQLVMSGSANKATDLPVKFLNLNRSDYITLLHAADVVITLSTLIEGWNRVAHEALLCKTPVIGSGTGGMQELLMGAGQQIIKDPLELPAAVQVALQNKVQLGETGYVYVSRFDQNYFEQEWIQTIQKLIIKNKS